VTVVPHVSPYHTSGCLRRCACLCVCCLTNQREMSSCGIGRFQFQGRVSSRHDSVTAISCIDVRLFPSGFEIVGSQVEWRSWRLLTRPWNWNRPIPRELISRWLVEQADAEADAASEAAASVIRAWATFTKMSDESTGVCDAMNNGFAHISVPKVQVYRQLVNR